MHIYAFGSVCRGEIDNGSDIDLLACVDGSAPEIDVGKYSVYRYERIRDLWTEGNPFAWHLHLESKLLFSSNSLDFLSSLGEPAQYNSSDSDYKKFRRLFERSYSELLQYSNSATFHLSCIFLAIRNLATCYSLSKGQPVFSRRSPLLIEPNLDIDPDAFLILTRARLLSTRGYGQNITETEVACTLAAVSCVFPWMDLLCGVTNNDQ